MLQRGRLLGNKHLHIQQYGRCKYLTVVLGPIREISPSNNILEQKPDDDPWHIVDRTGRRYHSNTREYQAKTHVSGRQDTPNR